MLVSLSQRLGDVANSTQNPEHQTKQFVMTAIGMILLGLGGIGSLVCWIMVLIKMFQNDKPLIGVLGILCSLWAFIWGWMKAGTLGLKKVMMIWTVCLGVTIVGNVIYGAGMASQIKAGIESGEIQIER